MWFDWKEGGAGGGEIVQGDLSNRTGRRTQIETKNFTSHQHLHHDPHKSSQKHTEFWARFHWSCWHWVWFWWGCWWFWRSWSSCRSRLLHHIFCDRRPTGRLSTGSLSWRKRMPLCHHNMWRDLLSKNWHVRSESCDMYRQYTAHYTL